MHLHVTAVIRLIEYDDHPAADDEWKSLAARVAHASISQLIVISRTSTAGYFATITLYSVSQHQQTFFRVRHHCPQIAIIYARAKVPEMVESFSVCCTAHDGKH